MKHSRSTKGNMSRENRYEGSSEWHGSRGVAGRGHPADVRECWGINDGVGEDISWDDADDYITDDDDDIDMYEQDDELLQRLSERLIVLSESVRSLRLANAELARSLGTIHDENLELQRQSWCSKSNDFPNIAEQSNSIPSKHARRVSIDEHDESTVKSDIHQAPEL